MQIYNQLQSFETPFTWRRTLKRREGALRLPRMAVIMRVCVGSYLVNIYMSRTQK